jgi:uncharacterized protein YfaP (DUF2135 family)
MANTYVKIGSTVTVGVGGAASIDFTSIPATYTDLVIKVCGRTNRAAVFDDILISFNGSTASFSGRELYGDGAAAASITTGRAASIATGSTATASTFGNSEIYVPNYAGSTNKSFSVDGVQETNATTAYAIMIAGLWSNTAAINQVTLTPSVGTLFSQYSTASLYGILKN